MTSGFEGQPPKTMPKYQSKQGSFRFQVFVDINQMLVSGIPDVQVQLLDVPN